MVSTNDPSERNRRLGHFGMVDFALPCQRRYADAVAFSILLAIGASFVSAGFVAWSLLQVKEIVMPIGDWIREANERRRQRIRDEGYRLGYQDAVRGKPPEVPLEQTGQTPPRESDKSDADRDR